MTMTTESSAAKFMIEHGWLTLVPDAFRAEVVRRSTLLRFAPGENVFRLGDPPGGIYGLVNGTVSMSIAPDGSAPRLILLGVPGFWTGEACFLTRRPRRGDVRAVVDTTMLHLPLHVLDQMAVSDSRVAHHVALILMMSVEFLLRVIHDLQKSNVSRRIASVLQRMTWVGDVAIPVTQSEIGIMANASRKQVNAALQGFAEKGWVKHTYRSIEVTNPMALRCFSDLDD